MGLQNNYFSKGEMGDIVGQKSRVIDHLVCFSGFNKIAQKIQRTETDFSLYSLHFNSNNHTKHTPEAALLHWRAFIGMNTSGYNVFFQPL